MSSSPLGYDFVTSLFITQQRDEAKTVGIFFKDRCPKDEATAKNFFWNKSSSHSQENWKNLLGGWMPPPPPSVG